MNQGRITPRSPHGANIQWVDQNRVRSSESFFFVGISVQVSFRVDDKAGWATGMARTGL